MIVHQVLPTTKATVGGVPPFSANKFEPLARVTLYLTDEKTLHDVLGGAWLIIALRIHVAKLRPQRNRGSPVGDTPGNEKKMPHTTYPPYRSRCTRANND